MSYTASQMPATITSNYTVQPYDVVILYDSSVAVIEITLPDPSLGRRDLTFISVNNLGGNGLTLLPYATETLYGTSIMPISGGNMIIKAISNLTDWYISALVPL